MHGDLNLANVRVDADSRLVGIVDIEALGAGSRAIDYASLCHSGADGGEGGDGAALNLVRTAGEHAAGPAAARGPFALVSAILLLEWRRYALALPRRPAVRMWLWLW